MSAAEGGVSFDELTLQVQILQAEKRAEEEIRNRMQLERVRYIPAEKSPWKFGHCLAHRQQAKECWCIRGL